MSEAYLKTNDYVNAEVWFDAAVRNPKEEFPYSRYFYGLTLMKNYKYPFILIFLPLLSNRLDSGHGAKHGLESGLNSEGVNFRKKRPTIMDGN